jgi:hypothetical protein
MRIYFTTDVHGSEICFKKFLNAGKFYGADVIILGGDTTGKMLVFLVDQGDGTYACSYRTGSEEYFREGHELDEFENGIRNTGYYPCRVSKARMRELNADSRLMDELFLELMLQTTERWMKLAEGRLGGTDIRCIIAPGNDDDPAIDEIIKASRRVEYAEGSLVSVGPHEIVSCGWTNPTPWQTYRECSEDELAVRLESLASMVTDWQCAIVNFHAPPYQTGLDEAPEISKDLQLAASGAMRAVGSTAVKEAILKHKPLLGLHGHIHESKCSQKLGRTLCINPGSAYADWILQGVVVDLEGDRIGGHLFVTG